MFHASGRVGGRSDRQTDREITRETDMTKLLVFIFEILRKHLKTASFPIFFFTGVRLGLSQ